jgi:hypothetical protein
MIPAFSSELAGSTKDDNRSYSSLHGPTIFVDSATPHIID